MTSGFPAGSGAVLRLGGALVYVVGMFGVTVAFNVPLNNAVARVDPASSQGAEFWDRYRARWTAWNHVRTLAALGAAVMLTLAPQW